MKIGIIGAMDVEVSTLQQQMTDVVVKNIAHLKVYEGKLEGKSVVLVKCGVGKVNAALCAQLLISLCGVTCIINSGVAGAVGPGLGVMDLVVSTDALYHDMDATGFGYKPCQIPGFDTIAFEADADMISATLKAYAEGVEQAVLKRKAVAGRIASGDIFVDNAQVKKQIVDKCNPMCVEMEGAAIAHTCWLNKVPFVVIRCMSDSAENTDEVYLEAEAAAQSSWVTARTVALL